jgi:hypothetical protein
MNRSHFRRCALAAGIAATLVLPLVSAATPAGGEFRVNGTTGLDQSRPSAATDASGDFVAVWISEIGDSLHQGVFARRYAATGAALGAEVLVGSSTTLYPLSLSADVAVDADGDFVVTWLSYSDPGIHARRYAANGTPLGAAFRVSSAAGTSPSVAVDADGEFVIAWSSSGDIHARRFAAGGTALGAEFRVNTYIADSQSDPSAAMDANGNFLVAWTSFGQDGSRDGVYAQRYAADGTLQGSEFRVNTYTHSAQTAAAAAMAANGDFVIAWTSYDFAGQGLDQDGSGAGIYAQRYAANGALQGAEFRVNTYITGSQVDPSVAMSAIGDFLIAWTSGQDGNESGIYGQRYAADGTPQGTEFRANTYTARGQFDPAVALDADGDAVIVWQSNFQDGGQNPQIGFPPNVPPSGAGGIYAQRYSTELPIDLGVTMGDQADPVRIGGQLRYSVQVSNLRSAATDTGIAAIDAAIGGAISPQLRVWHSGLRMFNSDDSALWACADKGQYVQCDYPGVLAAAANSMLTLVFGVLPLPATIQGEARVFALAPDGNPGNNIDFETTTVVCEPIVLQQCLANILGL